MTLSSQKPTPAKELKSTPQKAKPNDLKKPEYICIHHTGISNEKNQDQLRTMNSLHQILFETKSNSGSSVAWNYLINRQGRAHSCREDGERTMAAYQKEMNSGKCIHIALEGNFDIEYPTQAQFEKLKKLITDKCVAYKIPLINVILHKSLAPTKSCPGNNLSLVQILSLVGGITVKDAKRIDKANNIKEDN